MMLDITTTLACNPGGPVASPHSGSGGPVSAIVPVCTVFLHVETIIYTQEQCSMFA